MFGKPFLWHLRFALLVMIIGVSPVFIIFLRNGYLLTNSDPRYVDLICDLSKCQCEDWTILFRGNYLVENNVWNKGDLNNYRQCVYLVRRGDRIDAGWGWDWPGLRFQVVAYPSIVFGKKPWFKTSTSGLLPAKIRDLDCLMADFTVSQEGKGNGNLAFDLWLTSDEAANPESITRELMIWISHNGLMTAGQHVDNVVLDGYEIELWRKEGHNPMGVMDWTLLTFVYQTSREEGPINLLDFLDFLVENDYISADEYLADIELGNEIVSGYGQTHIRSYSVDLCE